MEGSQGSKGLMGPRGPIGPMGMMGAMGIRGRDGESFNHRIQCDTKQIMVQENKETEVNITFNVLFQYKPTISLVVEEINGQPFKFCHTKVRNVRNDGFTAVLLCDTSTQINLHWSGYQEMLGIGG